MKILGTTIAALLLSTTANFANADSITAIPQEEPTVLAQNHAGQMDTDGILSPGEVRNPNIDYDHAQRAHERAGDARVDNPANDDAARDDRYYKDEQRGQYYQQPRDNRDYNHDNRDYNHDNRDGRWGR